MFIVVCSSRQNKHSKDIDWTTCVPTCVSIQRKYVDQHPPHFKMGQDKKKGLPTTPIHLV